MTRKAPPGTRDGRGRKSRRRGAAIGISLLAHGAVLAVLAISAAPALKIIAPARVPPDVILELRPLATRPNEAADAAPRASAVSARAAPLAAAGPSAEAARSPLSSPAPSPTTTATASAPAAPRAAIAPSALGPLAGPGQTAAPGASALGDGRDWRLRLGDGDLRGRLHGLVACGSAQYQKLSPAERLVCDRKFADVRGSDMPHVDVIPAEKRAYYDAVAAAYAAVRSGGGGPGRMPVGPAAPGILADKGGVYLPGVGCAIRFGVPRGWKSYHDRPPHSLKLGALPCFITPPQALGTEESGVEAPASLRERMDDAKRLQQLEAPPH